MSQKSGVRGQGSEDGGLAEDREQSRGRADSRNGTDPTRAYAGQLAAWVSAYAAGRFEDLKADLDERSTTDDVRRFLVNSFGNRFTWLMRETALLADVLGDQAGLVEAYIKSVPRDPYDITGPSDEEKFLRWLLAQRPLNPVQRDFVTCQLGEFAVGTAARRDRPGHIAFQRLSRGTAARLPRLGVDPALEIHLNPIRFESRLVSEALAGGDRPLPVDIVFFPAGTAVRAVVLGQAEAEAVRELAAHGPCRLAAWAPAGRPGSEARVALARDFAAQGLIALDGRGV